MLSSGRKAILSALLLAGAAGWSAAIVMEDMVAKVNGRPILLSEYRKNLRSVLDQWQKNLPALLKDQDALKEIRRKVLDQMIDDEVLFQEAEKQKMKVYARELDKGVEEVEERNFRAEEETGRRRSDAEMAAALADAVKKEGLSDEQFRERIRKQLLVRKVLEEEVRSKIKEPEDKRVRDVFDKLKFVVAEGTASLKGMPDTEAQAYGAFAARLRDTHSERVRVSHILIKVPAGAPLVDKTKALERAAAIKKRIDGGEDFSDAASKESDDAESAPRGGDLGFILRGWMPAEFERTAFALGVGDVSAPIETNFGFHIIRVQEKKAKESMGFDKLKMDLKQFVMGLDMDREMQVLVKKLRSASTIEEKPPAD